MIWYKYLYTDESISHKKEKIKWKIRHNAGMIDMYVITLPNKDNALLEIISTIELMQKHYPKKDMFVVGIAKGYETATQLACEIVMEVYNNTGAFLVREYLQQRQHMQDGQVNGCP